MRSILAALILWRALITAAAAAPTEAGRLEFEILRNGSPSGSHVIEVRPREGGFTADSAVDLRVNFGPFNLFRYEQTCSETWRAGALTDLRCSTLKDGRTTEVAVRRHGADYRVTNPEGAKIVSGALGPTNWWLAPPTRSGQMIDIETGRVMTYHVERLADTQREVGEATISARHYRVRSTLTVDLWYDQSGRWLGCAFRARGQRIEYRLASRLSQAPASVPGLGGDQALANAN